MSRMETTDIVIHKGEKDDRYQLYVEDYVMSYLKKYKTSDGKKIFFYGTREQKEKKYYIYGAGTQKNISYFVRYELLEEIACHCDMDMPVFYIKEEAGRYEVAGYYIFYNTNEAMQSYMIEQKMSGEPEEKERDKIGMQLKAMAQSRAAGASKAAGLSNETDFRGDAKARTGVRIKKKKDESFGRGIIAAQLSAIFLILSAIIINSANSYTKLRELGQSAIEVFFTMENQEAQSEIENVKQSGGTTLRLEDLDSEFEKENQAAQQEDGEGNDAEEEGTEERNAEMDDAEEEKDAENSNAEDSNDSEMNNGNTKPKEAVTSQDKVTSQEESASQEESPSKEKASSEEEPAGKADAVSKEESPSQEAFARNVAEYYQIEKGDTLCNISIKMYGDASRVKEICEINKIENPDNIKYGQKILLP